MANTLLTNRCAIHVYPMSIKTNRNPTIVRRQGGAMSDDRHHLASGEIGPNLLFGPWSHAPRSGH